jgi:hypothetical protein
MSIDEPPFWLVWNPDNPTTPQRRYSSRKAATFAARKMAERFAHEGAVFYVLKTQSAHQKQFKVEDFLMADWGVGAPCPHHPGRLPY